MILKLEPIVSHFIADTIARSQQQILQEGNGIVANVRGVLEDVRKEVGLLGQSVGVVYEVKRRRK